MKVFKFIFLLAMVLSLFVGLAQAERVTIFNVTPIVSISTSISMSRHQPELSPR